MSISVGGILVEEGKVLLVQVNYGANKGLWMLPGGSAEPGESLEEALIREVMEETSLLVRPKRMIAVRNGRRLVNGHIEASLYIVFEMEHVEGKAGIIDANEISAVTFMPVSSIACHPEVIDLAKGCIKGAIGTNAGLYQHIEPIRTNTEYLL